jgi:hypothetical protein
MTAMEPQSIAAVLALGLIAALATAAPGQVPSSEGRPDGDVSAPLRSALSAGEIHRYAVLGAVARPGVYICVDDDLTLAELVGAAGGSRPHAAGSAQIIRRGHTGPRLNCSPPSTARLSPGDVVVVEAAVAVESGWVGVALVGLRPGEPVVIQVPAPAPTLDQLLAALNQKPSLVDSVRLLRTSSRRTPTSEIQLAGQLIEGDIVVFDPEAIDRSALAKAESFPPPVLIPRRERQPDVEMVIRPQQRLALDVQAPFAAEFLRMAATAAADATADGGAATGAGAQNSVSGAVENFPEEIWSLSAPRKANLDPPASQAASLPDAGLQSTPEFVADPVRERLASEGASAVASDADQHAQQDGASSQSFESFEQTLEADGQQSVGNSQHLVATSLVAAPYETSARGARGVTSENAEPERMMTPQGGIMIALAENNRHLSTATTGARSVESDVPDVALSPRVPAPSDPSTGGQSKGPAARVLPVGITVLATVLVCFAASLLWSRLGDSTGLPGKALGDGTEPSTFCAPPQRSGTLQRLINNALPIIEEPTLLPERADFHGEAVGRRRMRIDAEQNLSGPHFAAPQRAPQSVAVPEAAGTANTRPKRDVPPVDTPADEAPASSSRDAARGGLLDRVLVAMEREKRR